MKENGTESKKHLLFIVGAITVILAFVIAKLPVLHIPYFWDEIGVYVPGALRMKDQGTIGLMPSSLEPLYSRGHPLLFYFVAASFFSIFGDSVFAGHTLAILLAVVTLIVLFLSIRKVFSGRIAFATILLLAVQPVFFAMAGILLPEMLFTLFFLFAFFGLLQKRPALYIIGTSLAVLTKEPGLILVAAAGTIEFIDAIKARDFFTWKRWVRFMAVLVPLLIFVLFLVIQKAQNGWYFFPYHVELIHITSSVVWGTVTQFVRELFWDQGRWLLTSGVVLAGIWARFKIADKRTLRLVSVFAVVLFWAILFAGFNYYLSRYMLWIYPLFVLVAAQLLFGYLATVVQARLRACIATGLLGAALFLGILYIPGKKRFNDTFDMSYVHTVRVMQQAVAEAEQLPKDKGPFGANFPMFQALSDIRNGYLERGGMQVTDRMEQASRFIIYFYIAGEQLPENFRHMNKVASFEDAYANTVILEDVLP